MEADHPNRCTVRSNKDETLKLFNNRFLEGLTHAYPITLVYVYGPIVAYLSYCSIRLGVHKFLIDFVIGIFLWTVVEYFMHRYIFHYKAKGTFGKKIFFLIHEIHHQYPQDKTRLVTPPVISLPFAFLFGVLYRIIFGMDFTAFLAGTLFFYMIYETGHYGIHHYNFKNRLLRYLKRYHFAHHFLDNKNYFGVTVPFWDIVFRTKPPMPNLRSRHR